MLSHPLLPKLHALKLSGMLLTLDTPAAQAAQDQLTPTEFLAVQALKRGHTVVARSAHRLLGDLHAARADGTFGRRFARLCAVDLLALDDFGLRPLSPQAAEDLYDLIRERYERKSIILTSNRAFAEWPEAFGDGLLASAALDRLTHHCHTLVIRGQSYRQRGRRGEDTTSESVSHDGPELD